MRKLLISLVVVVGLAVGADFGAAAYAEYRVSRELRTELSLSADPDVRINGFPFLTQAVRGNYRSVQVRADGVPTAEIGPVAVTATLRDVRLPLSEVVSGAIDDVVADTVEASVRVSATALGEYLEIPDLEVRTPPPPEGAAGDEPESRIILTGTVAPFGKISVDAELVLRGGAVVINATGVDAGDDDAATQNPLIESALSELSLTLDPTAIPFGIVPTRVRAEGSEIVVEGTGADVTVVGGDTPGG